jgi:beta-glucanase (GH16 family)
VTTRRAWSRLLLLGLGQALVVATVLACGGATVTDPADAPAPTASAGPTGAAVPGWRLIWADEFDGPAGTPPDPAKWRYALGDGTAESIAGWGNQELESYTDDPANAATDGESHLVISALDADGSLKCWYGECQYTSARLLTEDRFAFEYGRVEGRLQVAPGQGLWSAFWMLGTDIGRVGWPASGEIDVMENVGRDPNKLFGTLHGPGYSGNAGFGSTIDLPAPLADDFHVYAIEWEPGRIVWTVDGEKYHEATPADVAPDPWVYDHEFYLLLNLAVGGGLGGPVRAGTEFPARYLIDYVRVYQAD